MRIPFGTYGGREVKGVPLDYLIFLRERPWITYFPDLLRAVESRLAKNKLYKIPEDSPWI